MWRCCTVEGFQTLTWSLFLCVAGWMVAVGVQGLRPLLASRVTRLVRMPSLFAVIAELCTAAFSVTHQPGTAGTTWGNDSKSEKDKEEDCQRMVNALIPRSSQKKYNNKIYIWKSLTMLKSWRTSQKTQLKHKISQGQSVGCWNDKVTDDLKQMCHSFQSVVGGYSWGLLILRNRNGV